MLLGQQYKINQFTYSIRDHFVNELDDVLLLMYSHNQICHHINSEDVYIKHLFLLIYLAVRNRTLNKWN